MTFSIEKLPLREFPLLMEIPDPPQELYIRGTLPPKNARHLAVVGARNYTDYGKQVVDHLIQGLRGKEVCIISGLAHGIDALAHEAALQSGIHTISIPGSGIEDSVIYPKRHVGLATRILESGGALLSEFDPHFTATAWSFPKRNRIMAGLAHAVLIVEATERSGTLITARLAVEYNRELLVVPGNIFSENTQGPHQFLKLGATPVTTPEDIMEALQLTDITGDDVRRALQLSEDEKQVLSVLSEPKDRDDIIRMLEMPVQDVGILLMHMELNGYIREENGIFYKTI